jgi:hypothetical protein
MKKSNSGFKEWRFLKMEDIFHISQESKMSVRKSFVEHFGEELAHGIERAALFHETRRNGKDKGSDRFKWALLIAIGYECTSVYQEHHNLQELDHEQFKEWCKAHGHLHSHDGDADIRALIDGRYVPYLSHAERADGGL